MMKGEMETVMKNMFRAFTVFVMLGGGWGAPPRAQQQQARQTGGAYTMYLGEQAAGTESYTLTVTPSGARRAEAEVGFGLNRSKVVTEVTADGRPLSFAVETGGARALAAEFGAGVVKLTAAGAGTRELKTAADVVVESLVWHHFINLLARYDAARDGRQSFTAFLPSQATEFPVELERVGAETRTAAGSQVKVEHFRAVVAGGLTVELWADAERVPLLITVPTQNVRVVRAGSEALAPKPAAPRAAPPDAPFREEEVTFENGDTKFAGTLTLPKKGGAPHPAALIISGSGGQDRDGTAVHSIYRLVAERLSAEGVAVLRVDDRGTGRTVIPKLRPVSYRELVSDSRAAFEYLLTRPDVDRSRVALIGHSEGAETALTLAAEDRRVAAVALMAGPSRPVDRIVYEQALYQTALRETVDPADPLKLPQVSRELMKLFDEARAAKAAGADPDKYAWFREHAASDPAALARRVAVPVLILNGERDAQVLPYHALELARALAEGGNRRVRLRIFPDLTHVFTPSTANPGAGEGKPPEVSAEFLQALQSWMAETLSPGQKGAAGGK